MKQGELLQVITVLYIVVILKRRLFSTFRIIQYLEIVNYHAYKEEYEIFGRSQGTRTIQDILPPKKMQYYTKLIVFYQSC